MLVQCPNCKTTYKVADDVLKGAAPAFRCSRCKHTFELEATEPSDAPRDPVVDDDEKNEVSPPDPELSFSFAPKAAERPEDVKKITPAESAPLETPTQSDFAAPQVTEVREEFKNSADDERWSMSESEGKADAPFTLSDTPSSPPRAKRLDIAERFPVDDPLFPPAHSDADGDDGNNILPMSSYMDQQASILPYITLLGLLVIVFSLLAVITHAHPKASEGFIKNIPLLGPSVLKNTHLKDGILIQSLRGGYQAIQGNREVFVMTGIALNQNPVVIREVQLTGKVFNEAGAELEQQSIWVGNTLSAKILRGMTVEDIPHLQNLKPLKSFELPPGDSIPFAIVFLKSTKSAKNVTCEVVLADSEV
jgi:predicted Zn finger-like uncharacterized protein